MNTKKEIAKFAAGAAAWEALGHLLLAFTGLLPLTVWGITLTPTFNSVWVVIVAAVSILLAWYAWGTGEAGEPTTSMGGSTPVRR